LALAITVAITLYLGILPDRVLRDAQQSAQDLLSTPVAAPSMAPQALSDATQRR
jgi:hypothetical protein